MIFLRIHLVITLSNNCVFLYRLIVLNMIFFKDMSHNEITLSDNCVYKNANLAILHRSLSKTIDITMRSNSCIFKNANLAISYKSLVSYIFSCANNNSRISQSFSCRNTWYTVKFDTKSEIIVHNATLFKIKRLRYACQWPSWKSWATHWYGANRAWFDGASNKIEYARRLYGVRTALRRVYRVVGT